MKAIVLGATGFIGSHIVRALNGEEIDVRVLRRSTSPTLALEGLRYESTRGDLNDRHSLVEAFRGCHVLFHAAGYYPIYSFAKKKQQTIALQQMKNVLAAAKEAKIGKIIYTSSMSTIGSHPRKPANEETPYDPKKFKGLYYEIKYLLEQEALAAAQRGFPLVVVNPTGVFGDYDVKPTSGTLVVKIARQEVPFLIDAKMNVVDVHTVARAQVMAMKLGKVGRRYIIGGHNTTVWKLSQLIAQLAKVPPPKIKLPLLLGRMAAYGAEVVGQLLHQDRPMLPRIGVDFLKQGTHYDTTRAETELGVQKVPMEETLARALAWFQKEKYI